MDKENETALLSDPTPGPGREKAKSRARFGNQNARKHGFYSSVLTDSQRNDFEVATAVEGVDEEIALLRIKIKSLVENDPDNIALIMRALGSLERMVRTKYQYGKNDRAGIKERVASVLKDIVLPLGIIGASLKK